MYLLGKKFVAALIASGFWLFAIPGIFAQETYTLISSNPPGAAITLDGDYKLSATTPCRLPGDISGEFILKAMLPGYETWKGDVMIIPGQDNKISFGLSPKTRVKAALRSLFIPGWGQYYAGSKSRAYVINITTVGFGIGTILADYDFRRKRDDYKEAQNELADATSYDEITRLQRLVLNKNRDAYDAETVRNTFAIVTASLWAYNFLDSFIFFPENKLYFPPEGIPIKQAIIQPDINPAKIGVKLTASF